jgi:hypothetical protein
MKITNKNTEQIIRRIIITSFIGVIVLMAHACNNADIEESSSQTITAYEIMSTESDVTEIVEEVIQNETETFSDELNITDTNPIIEPEVVSMTLTSKIQYKEPVDELAIIDINDAKFFTHSRIRSVQNDTIFHVYKFEGEEIAKISLFVGESIGWRTWSSKYIDPMWIGEWTVEIQSSYGNILASKKLTVNPAPILEDSTETTQEIVENETILINLTESIIK